MKSVPVVTIFLLLNTIFLRWITGAVEWWHTKLFRISGIEYAVLSEHSRYLGYIKVAILVFCLLCLVLLIVIWKNRLANPVIAVGISLLWVITFWFMLLVD